MSRPPLWGTIPNKLLCRMLHNAKHCYNIRFRMILDSQFHASGSELWTCVSYDSSQKALKANVRNLCRTHFKRLRVLLTAKDTPLFYPSARGNHSRLIPAIEITWLLLSAGIDCTVPYLLCLHSILKWFNCSIYNMIHHFSCFSYPQKTATLLQTKHIIKIRALNQILLILHSPGSLLLSDYSRNILIFYNCSRNSTTWRQKNSKRRQKIWPNMQIK